GWAASHYGSPPGSSLWALWENAYSKLGLNCGVSAAPPPPPPPPPPTPGRTLSRTTTRSSHPHLLPAFLIVGGGAALATWQLAQHPAYRHELLAPLEQDYRRARRGLGRAYDWARSEV
ncbi:MAG: hypothetical protein ACREN4_08095, partial [Candidatus Dormibacteria bacterium]